MRDRTITIGTRGSKLALAQTDLVVQAIFARRPDVAVNIKTIVTKGDTVLTPIPAGAVGKAWFTKELELAILSGEIDCALHSYKDMPPEIPEGLSAKPILKRGDPRDVLIGKTAPTLALLPQGSVIGTDSLRRKALILRKRPDITVTSIRGNIDTRIQKLGAEPYDALMLAAAGLERLGILDKATEIFDPREFVPAPGQGALAVEARADDKELWEMLSLLEDAATGTAMRAEQAFTTTIGGGCKLPVGCYTEIHENAVTVFGMVGAFDPLHVEIRSASGAAGDAAGIAKELAEDFLKEPAFAAMRAKGTYGA